MGMEMPLPIVETTPSVLHMELYKTINSELDALGVGLMRHLNRMGHASFFFTRDGFGSMRALREKNMAAFSHVMAAKYAVWEPSESATASSRGNSGQGSASFRF
jgi:hypothetical protein